MSVTQNYKTITISTGSIVAIEFAVRLEIAYLERRMAEYRHMAAETAADTRRLFELRVALTELSA